MKKETTQLSIIISLLLLMNLSCTSKQKSPMEELIKIGQELGKYSNLNYSYNINSENSYSGQFPTRKGIIYFKKNNSDTIIGMKYRYTIKFDGVIYENIYDGNYIYTLRKMDSLIFKKPLNDFYDGHCTTYPQLELSYCAIKLFLNDPNIRNEIDSLVKIDTLISSEPCTKYSFVANEKFLSTHKNFSKHNKRVELIVNRSSLLPVYYSQKRNFKSGNRTITDFSEVKFSRYSVDNKYHDSFFGVESIPTYYNLTKFKDLNNTLPINTPAPEWTLPSITDDSISLNNLKGQYVLLDFWFIGCGPCIQSIPMLNELQNKFSNDRLSVIGVNCLTDDVEKIKSFCANQDMNYPIVWN